ncbi:hypothetical protein PIB30_090946 [Stylosanthes scabra]|uniref:Uncharacterized protein n=1 Tax=Stylosanthes scabra TaxID=79078 RepID=A0ABU6YTE3_9FABA|nr:hypothetical protein [Stylosanthes scabra]
MAKEIESLTEDERRALRGSKFAPLPSLPRSSSHSQPRLAHPGGPLATNKAAALAKFLERKLKEPNGLDSINPDLLEVAVNNAKKTVYVVLQIQKEVLDMWTPLVTLIQRILVMKNRMRFPR